MTSSGNDTPGGGDLLGDLLQRREDNILRAWLHAQGRGDGHSDVEAVRDQSQNVLRALRSGLLAAAGSDDLTAPEFEPLRRLIEDISRRGVRSGASPSETAHGVLALREAVYEALQAEGDVNSADVTRAINQAAKIVDALALLTFETYVDGREQIILRQSQQLLELSTPVVQLWDGVVGVPLVGTLDSARAQVVMETLLQAIVDQRAEVAILDITGVPTVDTLVAQHLLKTVTATRLMGADCIISGIRPQTAQTIVQLGIDLADITTRATLADALKTAIERVGAIADRAH